MIVGRLEKLGIQWGIDTEERMERAAEHGDWDAQYNLGTFYEAGIGTARDAEQAKRWYIAAARQGQDEALEKCRAEGLSWE